MCEIGTWTGIHPREPVPRVEININGRVIITSPGRIILTPPGGVIITPLGVIAQVP